MATLFVSLKIHIWIRRPQKPNYLREQNSRYFVQNWNQCSFG